MSLGSNKNIKGSSELRNSVNMTLRWIRGLISMKKGCK